MLKNPIVIKKTSGTSAISLLNGANVTELGSNVDVIYFYADFSSAAVLKVAFVLANGIAVPYRPIELSTLEVKSVVEEGDIEEDYLLWEYSIPSAVLANLVQRGSTQTEIAFKASEITEDTDYLEPPYTTASELDATINAELKVEFPTAVTGNWANVYQTTSNTFVSWLYDGADFIKQTDVINEQLLATTNVLGLNINATISSPDEEIDVTVTEIVLDEIAQLWAQVEILTGAGGAMLVEDFATESTATDSVKFARNVGESGTSKSATDVITAVEQIENKGDPSTVAPLNASGKIERGYLPDGIKVYKGDFGAVVGTDLPSSGQVIGDTYRCDSNDYTSAVSGLTYDLNDTATWNGTVYITNQSGAVDTVNSISPDANGNIELEADDIPRAGGASSVEASLVALESGIDFTDLNDTPANYTDKALFNVRVNEGKTALEFSRPNNNSSTSVESGCLIEAGTTANTFKINSGTVLIVDTSGTFPRTFTVAYPGEDNVTPLLQVNTYVTYVTLSYNSTTELFTINQRFTEPTSKQRRSEVVIGEVYSFDATNISIQDIRHISTQPLNQSYDYHARLAKKEGLVIGGTSGATTFTQSAGKLVGAGINAANDIDDPNVASYAAQSPVTYYLVYRNGTGGLTLATGATTFDPNQYDDGTGTISVISPPNTATNHHFYIGKNGFVYIFLGQNLFTTLQDAINAQLTDTLQGYDTELLKNAVNINVASILKTATDFSNSAQADFYTPAVTGGGGGGSTGSVEDVNVSITATTENISGATLDLMLESIDDKLAPSETVSQDYTDQIESTFGLIAPLDGGAPQFTTINGLSPVQLVQNGDDFASNWSTNGTVDAITVNSNLTFDGLSGGSGGYYQDVDITEDFILLFDFSDDGTRGPNVWITDNGTFNNPDIVLGTALVEGKSSYLYSGRSGGIRIYFEQPNGATFNNAIIDNVNIIQTSNTPLSTLSASELASKFPRYIAYGLNDTQPSMQFTGLNLFDGTYENGVLSETTGEITTTGEQYRTTYFVPVLEGESYTISGDRNRNSFAFYDKSQSFISGYTASTTALVPSGAYYLRVYYYNDATLTIGDNFQLEQGTSATTYTAHVSPSPRTFEAYARSAGTVYDIIRRDDDKFVIDNYVAKHIIEQSDITTLVTGATNDYVNISLSTLVGVIPQVDSTIDGNIIVEEFWGEAASGTQDAANQYKIITTTTLIFLIVPTGTWSDLATARSELEGNIILYALENYTTTEIDVDGSTYQENPTTIEQLSNYALDYTLEYAINSEAQAELDRDKLDNVQRQVDVLESTVENGVIKFTTLLTTKVDVPTVTSAPSNNITLTDDWDNYDAVEIWFTEDGTETIDIVRISGLDTSATNEIGGLTSYSTTSERKKMFKVEFDATTKTEAVCYYGRIIETTYATPTITSSVSSDIDIIKIIGIKY